MSIKTTIPIGRHTAIHRIHSISRVIEEKAYRVLEEGCLEPDINMAEFVESNYTKQIPITELENWTDEMLEHQMDRPVYRYSMFDNYMIDDRGKL